MLFFTWLTWYTDHCDPFGSKTIVENGIEVVIPNQCVLSCGCFGNAIPLTPHESFIKDVVLLILLLPILLSADRGYGLNERNRSIWMYTSALAITWAFGEVMLEWGFPTLFLALGLAAAEVSGGVGSGTARSGPWRSACWPWRWDSRFTPFSICP